MNRVLAVAHSSRRRLAELITLATLTLAFAPAAYASGSSMPWETPLNSILESVQGPVAKIISVIIITVTGLTLAFGDTSGGFRRLIQIVFGLSIAFAASRRSRSSPVSTQTASTASSTSRPLTTFPAQETDSCAFPSLAYVR
jgi:type IV secretion system protein VirB2